MVAIDYFFDLVPTRKQTYIMPVGRLQQLPPSSLLSEESCSSTIGCSKKRHRSAPCANAKLCEAAFCLPLLLPRSSVVTTSFFLATFFFLFGFFLFFSRGGLLH